MSGKDDPKFLPDGTLGLEVTFERRATLDEMGAIMQGVQRFVDAVADAHNQAKPTVWVTEVRHPNSLLLLTSAFFIANKAAIVGGAGAVAAFVIGALNLSKAAKELQKAAIDKDKAVIDKDKAGHDRETARLLLEKAKVELKIAEANLGAATRPVEQEQPRPLPQTDGPERSVASLETHVNVAMKAAIAEWLSVRAALPEDEAAAVLSALFEAKLSPENRMYLVELRRSLGFSFSVKQTAAAAAIPAAGRYSSGKRARTTSAGDPAG
jgi:hypothetical protein